MIFTKSTCQAAYAQNDCLGPLMNGSKQEARESTVQKIIAFLAVSALSGVLMSNSAFARNRGLSFGMNRSAPSTYYQPRVVNTYRVPAPVASKDAYMLGGGLAGGVVGTACCGAYGGAVGGPVGVYGAAKWYDYQSQYSGRTFQSPYSYYYYPPAYGIQTTTPYMVTPNPYYR